MNTERPEGVPDRYLNGSYLGRNPGWHDTDGRWKAEQVTRMLARHELVPNSVCDIGCGTGGVLRTLRETFPDAYLYGYEPGMVPDPAVPSSDPRLTISREDPRTARRSWDLMLMLDVIEHVEDYIGFLRGYRSMATQAVLHIPLDLSVQTVLRATPLMSTRQAVGHLHYFCLETALATVTDSGYDVVDHFFTQGGVQSPSLTNKQKLAAIPRRAGFALHERLAARILGGFSLLVLATPH